MRSSRKSTPVNLYRSFEHPTLSESNRSYGNWDVGDFRSNDLSVRSVGGVSRDRLLWKELLGAKNVDTIGLAARLTHDVVEAWRTEDHRPSQQHRILSASGG